MPPKRPRVVPSQTNLSVQDVRDYSTPDGASMANEEMRRLKIALQEVADKQAAAVTAQQTAAAPAPSGGGVPPPPPPPVTTTYKWFVKAKAYNPQAVNNNDTVEFIGQSGIDVFYQSPRKLYISAINYRWNARAGSGTIQVKYDTDLWFRGINGVDISTESGAIIVDRPLTVYQRSIAIGDAATTGLDFFNEGNVKPSTYTSQVFFEVQDFGDGTRRIKGWSEPGGAGSYHWHASDGPHTHQVNNGGTVIWQGSNGVTVTLVPGIHTFTIDRPLQLKQNGNNVGAPNTTTIDFDNDTNSKPVTYTSQAWHEVIDNGSGHRTVKTWFAPGAGSYTWNIEASGTVGTQAVVSGATVKFTGLNGIIATRVNDDINLTLDPEIIVYPPGTADAVLFGELIFENSNYDYIGIGGVPGVKPGYRYGYRKYVDIVHNWNLGNPSNFEIELFDINLDSTGTMIYYRDGDTTLAGESIGPEDQDGGAVRFRNFPHVIGKDINTVRVFATMSRLKPTEMRFRYILRRV